MMKKNVFGFRNYDHDLVFISNFEGSEQPLLNFIKSCQFAKNNVDKQYIHIRMTRFSLKKMINHDSDPIFYKVSDQILIPQKVVPVMNWNTNEVFLYFSKDGFQKNNYILPTDTPHKKFDFDYLVNKYL